MSDPIHSNGDGNGNGHEDGRRRRSKRSPIFTTTPEVEAPPLRCPNCGSPMNYKQTVISGVKPIERWDYFQCPACGPYVYRERTRTLRPAT